MPKRKSSDECCAGGAVKRTAALQWKQHLYLLLDDWESGYSVHRLDVDAFVPAAVTGADDPPHPPPERFTEPPVAHIESDHVSGSSFFVSHGTKILAMVPGESSPAIPALDPRTLGLSVCPWPSSARDYVLPFFASVAGKLFVFPDDTRSVYLGDDDHPPPRDGKARRRRWSWTAMDARAPFYASRVTCYAVHPDGRTLFVSAASRERGNPRSGTFSLDTERLEWTRHGDWLLPFSGQAYFDAELEGWVGICGERRGAGRLCTCDVVAPPVAGELTTTSPPSWKLGEDELFRKDPKLHLGAKLEYMGHGRFCLVEHLLHKDDEHLRSEAYNCPPRLRHVLCVTTFGLRYNKEGQLRTTLQRARACKTYKIHHDSRGSHKPVAFWL